MIDDRQISVVNNGIVQGVGIGQLDKSLWNLGSYLFLPENRTTCNYMHVLFSPSDLQVYWLTNHNYVVDWINYFYWDVNKGWWYMYSYICCSSLQCCTWLEEHYPNTPKIFPSTEENPHAKAVIGQFNEVGLFNLWPSHTVKISLQSQPHIFYVYSNYGVFFLSCYSCVLHTTTTINTPTTILVIP